jgi:hypothetical protein
MILDVVSILKSVLGSGDLVADFAYRLETYKHDFLWTRDEMHNLWKLCSEYLPDGMSAIDHFVLLGEIACREKMLRQVSPADRDFWRKIVEYDEDELLQKAMFRNFLAGKVPNHRAYLKQAKEKFIAIQNDIRTELEYFKEKHTSLQEPGLQLAERYNDSVRIRFIRALDTAQIELNEIEGS